MTQRTNSPFLRQCLLSSGPIMVTISSGMTSGYSATLLPQLQSPNSTIKITESDSSWIASMAALPMALGCIFGGIFMESFGRKTTHLIVCVPFVIGWIAIGLAPNVATLLTGRFLTGLCSGFLGGLSSVYLSETSTPKFRGIFLAAISLAIAIGLFLGHLLGTFIPWQFNAFASATLPILCTVLLLPVPESPSWLAKKKRSKEARHAFEWCRGDSAEAKLELEEMLRNQGQLTEIKFRAIFDNLKRREFVKPLIIMALYFVTVQFSGVNAVTFYSVSIMQNTVGKGLNEYVAMLIVDAIRVLISIVACILTRKFGRRPLTFISGAGTALSLFSIAACSHFSAIWPGLSYVSLASFLTYIIFVSVGLVPLPWTLVGEVFPLSMRSVGSGISSTIAYTSFFVVVKTSPTMFDRLGVPVIFVFYGGVAMIGTFALYFCLPETKDKTLSEIENYFNSPPKFEADAPSKRY